MTILNFFDQICPKKFFFRWNWKKMNITIEFCIFELVLAPSFNLNW